MQSAADKVAALYLPAPHKAMFDPDPVKPESARQSASASEPAEAELLLEGHASQLPSDVCAVAALNLPITQSVHAAADDATALNLPAAQAATPEPEPVKPASALQSPSATDAAALPELSGQFLHDSDEASSLKVPGGQAATHSVDVHTSLEL